MGKRSTRGQLFLVAVVILLVIIAFTLLAVHYLATRPSPVVEEVSWRVNSQKVTLVAVGSGLKLTSL